MTSDEYHEYDDWRPHRMNRIIQLTTPTLAFLGLVLALVAVYRVCEAMYPDYALSAPRDVVQQQEIGAKP